MSTYCTPGPCEDKPQTSPQWSELHFPASLALRLLALEGGRKAFLSVSAMEGSKNEGHSCQSLHFLRERLETQTFFFFKVLGLELRAFTLSYSTSPIF
jgi:hypothetical protein